MASDEAFVLSKKSPARWKRRDRPYRGGPSPYSVKVKNPEHPAMERVIDSFG
jgi:hypothetical protein